MEILLQVPGFFLALMGWAATILLLQDSPRLTVNERRGMMICSWVAWMTPGFGSFVLAGLMATDTAALYVGMTTMLLSLFVLAGARARPPRTRP